MRTAIIICLYVLFFFLLFLLAIAGSYFSKFIERRELVKAAADVEANNAVNDKKDSHINLPDNFYLDPVVYPTAPRRPSKRVSLEYIVPDHLPLDSSANSSSAAAASKHGDEGANTDQLSFTSSIPAPTPRRPPRPTRLDDLLLGFPCEARATRDVWYPLANGITGRWELGVVRSSAKDARLLKDVDYHFVREVAENSAVAVEEAVVATPSQAPLDTQAEYPAVEIPPQRAERRRKSGKSSKRREDKARNVYPHGLEIPELHINARPYAEIEAEEEARATAMTPADANDA